MWPLLLLCVAIIIEHLMAFAGAKNSPDFVKKNGRPGPKRRFQGAQNACEGALKPARIEIIPMIDTIFFLLVFFPLSSLALTRLNGLPVELPDAKTAPAQSAAPPTLTIDRAGRLFLNRAPLQISGLEAVLKRGVRGGTAHQRRRAFRTAWWCAAWTRRARRASRASRLPRRAANK